MSQIKLTLRPPPNVDFVQGYPGIPPASPDRPQAAVKGAVEVRVGPQGVKAQWVQVALRKVETLPTGGQTNTFYDFIGPGPTYLWKASEDYGMLHSKDLPFYIRIPEAIPPTIALERGAGIKYELTATVCMKGKRGLFRRRKEVLTSAMAPVIIDKHELHSTWPVYCQPETRQHAQDGVTLTVERNQSCYGPGDRVSVMATIKSDSLHTVILRGFEFLLKETAVFRVASSSGKKQAPQAKVVTIGEQKVPVNATLYGGTHHKAELTCTIPATHTTASLNSARHIDIAYTINIKALMGAAGQHLIMDIPVTVSNWPRSVSAEAVRRIGPVPNLSLLPPNTTSNANAKPSAPPHALTPTEIPSGSNAPPGTDASQGMGRMPAGVLPQGFAERRSEDYAFGRGASARAGPSTLPVNQAAIQATNKVHVSNADELGFKRAGAGPVAPPVDHPRYGGSARQAISAYPNAGAAQIDQSTSMASSTGIGHRPTRSGGISQNRLTVANLDESDSPHEPASSRLLTTQAASPATSVPSQSQKPRGPWPTAEEEKKRLYEQARANVERLQGVFTRETQPAPSQSRSTSPPATVPTPAGSAASQNTPWPTAAEEKALLFEQAQAAARKTQAQLQYSAAASGAGLQSSDASTDSSSSVSRSQSATAVPSSKLSGAALYSQAISSMNKPPTASSPSASQRSGSISATIPQYPTAEEEKAALRRYQEAKEAVGRAQSHIAYDSTSHDSSYTSAPRSISPHSDLPPPFEGASSSSVQPSWMNEKEKLRRAYEAQDAAHSRQNSNTPMATLPASSSSSTVEKDKSRNAFEAREAAAKTTQPADLPPPFEAASSSSQAQPSWMNEKEKLRRAYEAQDAAAMAQESTAPSYFASLPGSASLRRAAEGPTKEPPRMKHAAEEMANGAQVTQAAESSRAVQAKRTVPTPPLSSSNSLKPLTAAEEKALLRVRYEAEQGDGQQETPPPAPSSAPVTVRTAAPPLKPRPPMEYIQETLEVDARVSRLVEMAPSGSAHSVPTADLLSGAPNRTVGTPPPPKIPM